MKKISGRRRMGPHKRDVIGTNLVGLGPVRWEEGPRQVGMGPRGPRAGGLIPLLDLAWIEQGRGGAAAPAG